MQISRLPFCDECERFNPSSTISNEVQVNAASIIPFLLVYLNVAIMLQCSVD